MSMSKELSWGIKLNQTCVMFPLCLFLASGETGKYTDNSTLDNHDSYVMEKHE